MKAIFMDYYGTLVHEMGPIAQEVLGRVCRSCPDIPPKEVLAYWWSTYRERLAGANGENFKTQHDVAKENFEAIIEKFHSPEDPEVLLEKMEEHWRTTQMYEDAPSFLDKAGVPVYLVTNSDDDYVYANLKLHGLHVAGVFSSEQAHFSKPRKEHFLYALEKTGLSAGDVLHIGDSLASDVYAPGEIGIRAIWLNREQKEVPDGVCSAASLPEVLSLLKEGNDLCKIV